MLILLFYLSVSLVAKCYTLISCFPAKTRGVGTQKNRLNETILLSTQTHVKLINHRRRKLFNIGGGGTQRGQIQYLGWGVLQNVHTGLHAHTHTCMHAYTRMYMLLNVHTSMDACTHTCVCKHAHAYAQIHLYIYTLI